MQMIAVDDILYFQAQDKYTRVITADGEALIRKPIKELYEELDPELFWQIHRATIVSLRAIARVDRDARGEPIILLAGPQREAGGQPHVLAPLQGDVTRAGSARRDAFVAARTPRAVPPDPRTIHACPAGRGRGCLPR